MGEFLVRKIPLGVAIPTNSPPTNIQNHPETNTYYSPRDLKKALDNLGGFKFKVLT